MWASTPKTLTSNPRILKLTKNFHLMLSLTEVLTVFSALEQLETIILLSIKRMTLARSSMAWKISCSDACISWMIKWSMMTKLLSLSNLENKLKKFKTPVISSAGANAQKQNQARAVKKKFWNKSRRKSAKSCFHYLTAGIQSTALQQGTICTRG